MQGQPPAIPSPLAKQPARAANAIALGADSVATFERSAAIGAGAVTSADNEIALGGIGSKVRIGDIEASSAAQRGPVDVVTVDANQPRPPNQ